jgi:hypothetical protein
MAQDPYEQFGSAIADAVNLFRRQRPSPQHDAAAQASSGAFLLGLCGYAAVAFGPYRATLPPSAVMVWAGLAGFGLLLVAVGVRGARGPRDVMMAVQAVALPLGGWWMLRTWQGPHVFDNFFLQWLGCGCVPVAALRLFLALRGVPGDAQKNVQRHIEQNETVWRSARR